MMRRSDVRSWAPAGGERGGTAGGEKGVGGGVGGGGLGMSERRRTDAVCRERAGEPAGALAEEDEEEVGDEAGAEDVVALGDADGLRRDRNGVTGSGRAGEPCASSHSHLATCGGDTARTWAAAGRGAGGGADCAGLAGAATAGAGGEVESTAACSTTAGFVGGFAVLAGCVVRLAFFAACTVTAVRDAARRDDGFRPWPRAGHRAG